MVLWFNREGLLAFSRLIDVYKLPVVVVGRLLALRQGHV